MLATIRQTALCLLIAMAACPAHASVGGAIGHAAESVWKHLTDMVGPPPTRHVPHMPLELDVHPDQLVPAAPSKPPDLPNPHRYGEPLLSDVRDLPAVLRPLPPQSNERISLSWKIAAALDTPPRLILAHRKAVSFGKEFSRGAHGSEKYLGALGKTNPLVASWLDAPVGLRVFVVGAAESDPDVKEFRDRLRALGYQVFFYKFCKDATGKLCASEEVGAFYATAGHAVAFRSADFDKSPYVKIEVATIYQHSKGGILLVFTPEDAALAGLVASTGTVAATCFDIPPSKDRRKVASRTASDASPKRVQGGCPA